MPCYFQLFSLKFLPKRLPVQKELHFWIFPWARGPAALGAAYTALASDAYAPIYNPAGLGFLSSTQIAAQHLSYLESIDYEFLSVVHPLGNGKALGASAQYLGTGNIAGTDPQGNPNGSYTDNYGAYSLVYGQKLTEKLSLGLTGKWIHAQLADVSANAYAADIGSLYQVADHLKLALTAANLGSKLTFTNEGDTLPEAVHLGAAWQPTQNWVLTGEEVYNGTGLLSERLGIEWSPLPIIAIRTGYRTDTTKELNAMAGLTAGVGLKVWGQEFAYAWLPYGDLGDTQYFSLLLRFGAQEEGKRNLIQYQSIKKHRTVENDSAIPNSGDADDPQLMQLLNQNNEPVAQSGTQGKQP